MHYSFRKFITVIKYVKIRYNSLKIRLTSSDKRARFIWKILTRSVFWTVHHEWRWSVVRERRSVDTVWFRHYLNFRRSMSASITKLQSGVSLLQIYRRRIPLSCTRHETKQYLWILISVFNRREMIVRQNRSKIDEPCICNCYCVFSQQSFISSVE